MAQASKKTMIKRAGSIFVGTEKKLMKKSSNFSSVSMIVPVMSVLIDFLEKKGKDIEGIFRVSGSVNAVQALKEELMNRLPSEVTPNDEWDPHVVAGMIKLLLRELEEPLLTFSAYEPLLMSLEAKQEKDQLQAMMIIVDNIPQDNKFILGKLLDLFSQIDSCGQTSKMSTHNLAVVMGPTILRQAGESFETMMTDSPKVVEVVNVLIRNVQIFPKCSPVPPAPVEPAPPPPCTADGSEEIKHKPSQGIGLDKRTDWKKKYHDLKRNYDEILTLYEELKQQNSVLENKLSDFEEVLDVLETKNSASKPDTLTKEETTGSDEDPLQKLKSENDRLKEVLIRSTREDIANCKEDFKIKPKDSMIFNLKEKFTDSITSLADGEGKEDRKSLRVSASFIKRQNSSKKILKGKITKDEPQPTTGGTLPKREHSSSVNHRSLTRKDLESIFAAPNLPQGGSEIKLPPLNSLHETEKTEKPEKTSNTPRNDYGTLRLPRLSLSSKQTEEPKLVPLSARFDKVQHQATFGPSPQHKPLNRTTTISSSPKWNEANTEHHGTDKHDKENANPTQPKAGTSKMTITEVLSKFHDFEKRVAVKQKVQENELGDMKREMDDMKTHIDTLATAVNHISQKL